MPFFDGAVGRVYYRTWTAEEPRAGVVFLHGFGEHSGLYHRLAGRLDLRGISLWALDEVGHGLSEGPRGRVDSIDDLVHNARLLTAIAQESGLPLVLAGHSLGAAAAALAVSRDAGPYAGLVLSGAPVAKLEWIEGADIELDPADLSADPAYLDALTNDPLAFTEAEAVFPGQALGKAWVELADTFAGVTLNTLFVHGSEDVVVPVSIAEEWSAKLPSASLARFEGAKHDLLNETVHRQVATTIADFVLSSTQGKAA